MCLVLGPRPLQPPVVPPPAPRDSLSVTVKSSNFSPPGPGETLQQLSLNNTPFTPSMATHSQDDPGSLLEKALLLNSSQVFCKEG